MTTAIEAKVESTPAAVARRNGQRTSARLMLVDDEPLNTRALMKYLRSFGYKDFVATEDPTQALALIRSEQPDLLLLDVQMPRLNGLDLLRLIRQDEALEFLPVIILTAYSDKGIKLEALRAGANDFLTKPVDPSELATRVSNVLALKARQDQLVSFSQELEEEVQERTKELLAARHAVEVRYLAGKAEIATDVLHNVGNALNSVNAAVNLLEYTLRKSKAPSLKRVADLLLEKIDDLPRFLKKDERGRVLPSYLGELAEALLRERDESLGEIALLTKHLEHIRAVVATQQKHARMCAGTEALDLAELLRDAEELLGSSHAWRGIEVLRDEAAVPAVKSDKQKLLQVVVNLMKNALQSAAQAHGNGGGRVYLGLAPSGPNAVRIEIRDNGVGIAAEDTVKVFGHGVTTKDDGSGFGLQSCANIIKELGGTIRAESDGPGRGAAFYVEIPIEPVSSTNQIPQKS